MTQGTSGLPPPQYNWNAGTVGLVVGDRLQDMSTEELYFMASLIFMKTGDDSLQKVTMSMEANIEDTQKYNAILKVATLIEKEMSTKGTDSLASVLQLHPELEQDFNEALKITGMAPFQGHTGTLRMPDDLGIEVDWPMEIPQFTEKEREWLMKSRDGAQLVSDYERSNAHHFVVSEGDVPPNWGDHVYDLCESNLDAGYPFIDPPGLKGKEAEDLAAKIRSFRSLQDQSTAAWLEASGGMSYTDAFPDLEGGIDPTVTVSEFSMFMVDLKGKIDINGKELQQIMVQLQQAMQKPNFATAGFSSSSKAMNQTKEKIAQQT